MTTANTNSSNKKELSLDEQLFKAVDNGAIEGIREALALGANPNVIAPPQHRNSDKIYGSVFNFACVVGKDDEIKAMLQSEKIKVDLFVPGSGGETSCRYIATSGAKNETLQAMQDYFERHEMPANPALNIDHLWNPPADIRSKSLFVACVAESPGVLDWMMNNPKLGFKDPQFLRENGFMMGYLAIETARPDALRVLLSSGLDPLVTNQGGKSLLQQAKETVITKPHLSLVIKHCVSMLSEAAAAKDATQAIGESVSKSAKPGV